MIRWSKYSSLSLSSFSLSFRVIIFLLFIWWCDFCFLSTLQEFPKQMFHSTVHIPTELRSLYYQTHPSIYPSNPLFIHPRSHPFLHSAIHFLPIQPFIYLSIHLATFSWISTSPLICLSSKHSSIHFYTTIPIFTLLSIWSFIQS